MSLTRAQFMDPLTKDAAARAKRFLHAAVVLAVLLQDVRVANNPCCPFGFKAPRCTPLRFFGLAISALPARLAVGLINL